MEFHAKEQLPGLLDWMRQQMKACGGKTAVIGISGGKDSSVVAALAVAAYGKENVVGVLMPDGIQPDIDRIFREEKGFDIVANFSEFATMYSTFRAAPAAFWMRWRI